MRGGRRQGWGIIENENLQGTQTDLLTYVETEGCQDGRDGRERGVDEHAPLVLSIHIHDFFYYVLVVEKMLSYSLPWSFWMLEMPSRGQSTLMAGNSSR